MSRLYWSGPCTDNHCVKYTPLRAVYPGVHSDLRHRTLTFQKDIDIAEMSPMEGNAEMQAHYQSWAEQNYGDSGKTKTVTRKKYRRIVSYLRGDESPTTENAKFRFWVKGKGFKLGPANPGYEGCDENCNKEDVLYVPVKTTVSCIRRRKYVSIISILYIRIAGDIAKLAIIPLNHGLCTIWAILKDTSICLQRDSSKCSRRL